MKSQYNLITNQNYQGKNQAELLNAKKANKYTSNAWLTFLQARSKKLLIIKGSKGVSIFKGYENFTKNKLKDGEQKIVTESRPLGFAKVFNLDQTKKYDKN